VLKCRDCAAVCHIECKHDVPMPCVANAARTPNTKINSCYLVSNYSIKHVYHDSILAFLTFKV
jgi:hypothetical protein